MTDGFVELSKEKLETPAGINELNRMCRQLYELVPKSEQSRVSVRRETAQTIANMTATVVQFATEDYDAQNEYDSAVNYRFTAKRDGIYSVKARIIFNTAAWAVGDIGFIGLYKNGAAHSYLDQIIVQAVINDQISLSGSMDISLVANDYIDIQVYHNRGADTNLYNSGLHNYFCITEK